MCVAGAMAPLGGAWAAKSPPAAAVQTAPDREFANPAPARAEGVEAAPVHAIESVQAVQAMLAGAASPTQPGADAYVDPRQAIRYQFQIRMTHGRIYNPWTGSDDEVMLRAYHGSAIDPAVPFLAPTITMRPGQTVRIRLENDLPHEPGCDIGVPMNTPHCFNTTNLHSHGLWVSPTGNSDNVLLSINPGVAFEYEYNLPSDHAAGTFWYHPHHHGSTALQVSSGMDGALIIKDDRRPTLAPDGEVATPGDVDILMNDGAGHAFPDKVMLFQQVQYACFDDNGRIETAKDASGKPVQPWICKSGQMGEIRDYATQFSPSSTWQSSGRFTSINGRVQPEIGGLTAGRFERWRLIHGGVRESVNFTLYPLDPKAPDFRSVRAKDQQAWMNSYCKGSALPMWEMALDGLTRHDLRQTNQSRLQPGYRADMLVWFPKAGRYCVIDGGVPASASVTAAPENQKLLAVAVVAEGDTPAGTDPSKLLQDQLVKAAQAALPAGPARDKVVADLNDGLKLGAFVWHKTIDRAELNAPDQKLSFFIDTSQPSNIKFEINGQPYDPGRIDRQLILGQVQQWDLTSDFVAHPFHIHVNPFQVVSVLDANGNDVTDPKSKAFDPDYAGVIGQWKDTLFVKQAYQIQVRTRYERYIGEFVLHCHILDHEDQGMMQNVRISLPDGMGGMAMEHHH